MAETKFPNSTTIVNCPIQDCFGEIVVELSIRADGRADDGFVVNVRSTGFKLLGEHNHPDPWMQGLTI